MIEVEKISKVYSIIRINKKSWSLLLENIVKTIANKNRHKIIKRIVDTETINLVTEAAEE